MTDDKKIKLKWNRQYPYQPAESYIYGSIHPNYYEENKPAALSSPSALPATQLNNKLLQGDNLNVMSKLLETGYGQKLDLIYIDPPFLSNSKYIAKTNIGEPEHPCFINQTAFHDTWNQNMEEYLNHLHLRLVLMKELLSPRGSIFVHLDWHSSHYVKILLDEIFGPEHFINEIVWCYGGGGSSKKHFRRKHDVIFWYSKGRDYIFHPPYRPYSEGTIERGLTKVKGGKYQLHQEGALFQDWWDDINKILSPTAFENLKYPTQKPLALLHRIVNAASEPGSLIADFYAGSGTLAAAAENTGRNYIACDNSRLAFLTSLQRLVRLQGKPFMTMHTLKDTEEKPQAEIIVQPLLRLLEGQQRRIQISNYHLFNGAETLSLKKYRNLIAYWDIDQDYSGENFSSEVQVVKTPGPNGKMIPLGLELPGSENMKTGLRIIDCWGNISYWYI